METYKICPRALGLAIGIMWGLAVLVMGLLSHFYNYGVSFVESLNTLYIVYDSSIQGSFIGGIIGFVGGFLFGFILAWLYNLFAGCHCKKEKQSI